MKQAWNSKGFLLAFVIGLMLACGPTDLVEQMLRNMEATRAASAGYDWYVSTDGSDTYTCNTPLRACKTLEGAVEKALGGDSIYIAAGTYAEPRTPGATLNINRGLTIQGAGADQTFLDFTGNEFGILINNEIEVTINDLTVQNVKGSDSLVYHRGDCIGVDGPAIRLTLQNVVVRQCGQTGLSVRDVGKRVQILLDEVTLVANGFSGIRQYWGSLMIEGGYIGPNLNSGIYLYDVNLTSTNNTVEDNVIHGIEIWGGTANFDKVHIINNGGGPSGAFMGGRPEFGSVSKAGLAISESDMSSEVTVANSLLDGNVDGVVLSGGHAQLNITSTTIKNHYRVGLKIISGNARVDNTILQHNGTAETIITPTERAEAGGVWVNLGNLELENSQVLDNYGGVSVWGTRSSGGTARIISTTIRDNDGYRVGGIFNKGNINIANSTMDGNQSATEFSGIWVGGIYNGGKMEITNSTISGNHGAGILESWSYVGNVDALYLYYSTVAENEGPGIAVFTHDPLVVDNSVVGLNGGGDCFFEEIASIARFETSMDTDGSCGGLTSTPHLLRLGPLADNGGPTRTHALLDGSPAIGAATGECPESDQRVETRPVGYGCDLGAYEYGQAAAPPPDTLGDIPATPAPAQATAIKNANCRYGPSTAYDIRDTLFEGENARIEGRIEDNTWWQVELPLSGKLCWVSYITVQVSGDIAGVPIGEAPPLPEAPPEEPPAALQGCFTYDQYQNVVCMVPCPPNPQPGGACTP
jgi:hypothetical protein